MPITPGDVLLKYSAAGASAGNTVAGNAAGSLGGYISTTQIPSNVIDALFPDVTALENEASNVDYACVFVHNQHATLGMTNTKVYVPVSVDGGADFAVALDQILPSAIGTASPQATTIEDKDTEPEGVGTFSEPGSAGAAIPIGTLQPGQCKAIWLRRTAAGSMSLANDGVTLRIECD